MSWPIPLDACEMEPYRVEWRADLVTGWSLLTKHAIREEADASAAESVEQYGGQARVITQHVVGVHGLNATGVGS